MARTEFQDFVDVRQTTAAPGPDSKVIVCERFTNKTFQVKNYQSGTFKIMGTLGEDDAWQDVPGCTAITSNGFYTPALNGVELTLRKVKVVTTVDASSPSHVPKVSFGGLDMRTDGA